MSENPDRMKHVSDVPLKFEGGSEADLPLTRLRYSR